MPSPLDSFMDSLQKRHTGDQVDRSRTFSHTSMRIPSPDVEKKCELTLPAAHRATPVSSIPAHTHTPEGFPNSHAEMKCETKCEGSLTLQGVVIQPGCLITWQKSDGIPQGPASVDCLHFDEDGSTWVFVTLPDGWAAINARYVTVVRSA